jgi:hypothetical protein
MEIKMYHAREMYNRKRDDYDTSFMKGEEDMHTGMLTKVGSRENYTKTNS